jgi:hypothetical protein
MRVEMVRAVPQGQKHVLDDVFGLGVVVQEPMRHGARGLGVALVQVGQGHAIGVLTAQAQEQGLVAAASRVIRRGSACVPVVRWQVLRCRR